MTKAMDALSRFAFGAASLVLMTLSLALIVYGTVGVIAGTPHHGRTPATRCSPRSAMW